MSKAKKPATRIVGIDFGLKRFGIAISDESKIIATPLTTLQTEKRSEATLAKLMEFLNSHQKQEYYSIEEIVIGLPLMMSGASGLLADEVKHFVTLMKQVITIPIVTWDERLTSVQADRSMREGQLSRKKRAQHSDVVAAIIILQNYLDYKHRMQETVLD
jgi:putative Holliday junction resolvase